MRARTSRIWFFIPCPDGKIGHNRIGQIKFYPSYCPLNSSWIMRDCRICDGRCIHTTHDKDEALRFAASQT
jgi:hypothetical protein